jgi:hypothetical protein
MTLHRRRKRLGLRPVTVIVSEREIDFLLARHYSSPARTTARSPHAETVAPLLAALSMRARKVPSMSVDLGYGPATK